MENRGCTIRNNHFVRQCDAGSSLVVMGVKGIVNVRREMKGGKGDKSRQQGKPPNSSKDSQVSG